MDGQHAAAERQSDGNTYDFDGNANGLDDKVQAFDGPWFNLDDIDFSASTSGMHMSSALPGAYDDLNSLPFLDNPTFDNLSPMEPLSAPPYDGDVFDFSTLQNLVQQDPPAAPRQQTLPRRRSKYMIRRSESNTSPITIPISHHNSPSQPVAIQRWQNSPPEEEAASLSAIYNAMEQRPLSGSQTPNFDQYKVHRVPSSTTSLESESSIRSANSNQSKSKSQRRRKLTKSRTTAKGKAKPKDSADRIFKCTFCCDTFKHKYDWSRHEKSLHLNMEEWVCAPHVS